MVNLLLSVRMTADEEELFRFSLSILQDTTTRLRSRRRPLGRVPLMDVAKQTTMLVSLPYPHPVYSFEEEMEEFINQYGAMEEYLANIIPTTRF